jgi:hypothetical protein
MRSHSRRYPRIARSKLTSGSPSCSKALKCSLFSVHNGTITQTLALIWLYILVAGAPRSAIQAGVVATFVLGARLLGRQAALG